MKKKLLLIIPAVFLLVVIGLVVYWNPPTTPVSYKFDAVKLDLSGKEYGSYPIEITGDYIEPYFGDPRLNLTIEPFDGMWFFYTTDYSSIFEGSRIEEDISGEIMTVSVHAFDPSANAFRGSRLYFSPDFDRWIYCDFMADMIYVGSVSGSYTMQELCEYFDPVIPGQWSAE